MTPTQQIAALTEALKQGIDLIKGEKTGSEWKRGCADFIRTGRASLAAVQAPAEVEPLMWELRAGNDGPYYSAYDHISGTVVEAPDEATCDAIDRNRSAHPPASPTVQDAARVPEIAALIDAAKYLAGCCQLGEDADWEEGDDPLAQVNAAIRAITQHPGETK